MSCSYAVAKTISYLSHNFPENLIFIVGLIGLLLIWYVRGRRHRALFNPLTPLLDEHSGEMQTASIVRAGEDHVQGHYDARDVLFSIKDPVQGHESSLFRVVLGSPVKMPFAFSVQKRMLLGIVSQPQPGHLVKTGNKEVDGKYYIADLTRLTGFGIYQKLFGSSRISKDVQDHLQRRQTSWLQQSETVSKLEILFRSCGVDYLSTQIEYPGKIELPASRSGFTAVLRHYSKRQVKPENVARILETMNSLLRSAESLMEIKALHGGSKKQ
jgi:hypothetical protein